MAEVMEDRREYLTLEEIHEEELKLLLVFDSFCKAHQLRYSLGWGTLLGAIRHKGFIPWDDDVDVNMPRPDFDKLYKLQSELPAGISLIDACNSAFAYPCVKFSTSAIHAVEPSYEGLIDEYLWLDIFVMDGADDDQAALNDRQLHLNQLTKRNVWASINHAREPLLRRAVKKVGGWAIRRGDPRKAMLDAFAEAASCPGYQKASRVTSYVAVEDHGWSLDKKQYEAMTEVEFEGHLFPAMGCWDEYLTEMYGDYMTVPPKDKQITHCIKAWRA